MGDRPSFGDIVACAALASSTGGALIGLGLPVFGAMTTANIENAGWAIVLMPLLIALAMFTAWPIGTVVGMLVSRAIGGGYWPAGISGCLTAIILVWLFGFLDSDGSPAMIGAILVTGLLSSLFGWRAVMRGAVFGEDR